MFEKIFDEIKTNLKNPRLYIFILIATVTFLVLFPYIDANFFYSRRVSDRVEILTKMSLIDENRISDNPILVKEYDSILIEIAKQADGNLGSIFIKESNSTVNIIKFVTGGTLFWVLAIACFFIKTFKNRMQRAFCIVLVLLLGCIFGWISMIIPTIINSGINYVGFPFVTFVLLALIVTSSSKKK